MIKTSSSFACVLMLSLFCNKISSQNKGNNLKLNERPNIVLIMTDQQQAQALSCAGNLDLKTQNLQKRLCDLSALCAISFQYIYRENAAYYGRGFQ
jgi:hypothetical protein